ncbi:probable phospholipid-transporting ATPase IIB [Diaphorina citri]|uniref:Probable phospholipid-transporting ATPase IIB n=1 Tax=Diaphorina citri TaxID=121845 RepID=A0A1S4EP46_DIACI|nr:probable phospholipid-transporting ATPase IIB [Diaphorina citri]
MNNSQPRSKVGLLDIEINQLTKVLFGAVVALAFVMMCMKGFSGPWYRYMFRFVLLFSYIIPIRSQELHVFGSVSTRTDAHLALNTFRKKPDSALIISGDYFSY